MGHGRLLPDNLRADRGPDRGRRCTRAGTSRWTAAPALLSGVAFVADGVNVSYHGFVGANPANLISLASFVLFAVAATVAAWWPRAGRSGGMGMAADTP